MNRRAVLIAGIFAATFACATPALATMPSSDAPRWEPVCTCLGDRTDAEQTAQGVRLRLDGLRTMLVPVQLQAPEGKVLLYELYVKHDAYNGAELRRLLGMGHCRHTPQ